MLVLRNKAEVTTSYPINQISDPEKILFFDIETTGFSRKYCHIYLIGCMYYCDDSWMYTQWFAENKNDEANVLMAFYQFMNKFNTIIHFNGNSFDIPFVKERGEKYHLEFNFEHFHMIDLYKSVSGMNHILKMKNQRQKTFEILLGITRNDPFSGGDLVEVYQEYVRTKDEKLVLPLLLHNKEDVWNMASLLALLSISDLFDGKFNVADFFINTYGDVDGEEKQELKIKLTLDSAIPIPISYQYDRIYLIIKDKQAGLSVPVIEDTLKFFFENYKDYYYLPIEDKALHKSVASFVDSKYRRAATRETCYEKVTDTFIPIYDNHPEFSEIFKKEFVDNHSYIKSNKLNADNIKSYALNILSYCKQKPSK